MKKHLVAAVIVLSALSAFSAASEFPNASGVVRFTGAIVKGPCNFSTATWERHAGRQNGISPPGASAVPAAGNLCAGIADTQAISASPVRDAQGVVRGRIITVSYN